MKLFLSILIVLSRMLGLNVRCSAQIGLSWKW